MIHSLDGTEHQPTPCDSWYVRLSFVVESLSPLRSEQTTSCNH